MKSRSLSAALLSLALLPIACTSKDTSSHEFVMDLGEGVGSRAVDAPLGADWYMRRDALLQGLDQIWWATDSSFANWSRINSPTDLRDTKLGGDSIPVWFRARIPSTALPSGSTITITGLVPRSRVFANERAYTPAVNTVTLSVDNVIQDRSLLDLFIYTESNGEGTGVEELTLTTMP